METFEIPEESEGYYYRCQEWEEEDELEPLDSLIREGTMYIKGTTEYNGEQWTLFDREKAKNNFFMIRTEELNRILGKEGYEIY